MTFSRVRVEPNSPPPTRGGVRGGGTSSAIAKALSVCGFTLTSLLAATSAQAQSHPEYVPLGRVQAALYKPDSGPAPHVAFLVAHRTANNLSTSACTELSKRGFMVLCFNTRFI